MVQFPQGLQSVNNGGNVAFLSVYAFLKMITVISLGGEQEFKFSQPFFNLSMSKFEFGLLNFEFSVPDYGTLRLFSGTFFFSRQPTESLDTPVKRLTKLSGELPPSFELSNAFIDEFSFVLKFSLC